MVPIPRIRPGPVPRMEDLDAQSRRCAFGCSLDGFGAGLGQSQSEPFGKNSMQIMNWFFPTRTFKAMCGVEGGTTALEDSYAARSFRAVAPPSWAATCSAPFAAPWADEDWKGWWGDTPPFKHPVFVLTHHPRPALGSRTAHPSTSWAARRNRSWSMPGPRPAARTSRSTAALQGPGLLESPAPRRAAPGQGVGLRGGRRAAPGRAGGGERL